MNPDNAAFIKYLSAKSPTDDRSINSRLWQSFVAHLERMRQDGTVRIVELGSGIGSMCERVFRSVGTSGLHYTLVDENGGLLEEASRRIGGTFPAAVREEPGCLEFRAQEAGAWLGSLPPGRTFDVLMANAFLDLVNIPVILDMAFSHLKPGGLAYFTVNYDGLSDFLPSLEDDSVILRHYHESMRATKGSYAGTDKSFSQIFRFLTDRGYPIIDSGASDWVIVPREQPDSGSRYSRDEIVFLQAILSMVESSVSASDCDARLLSLWMAERRRQLDQGRLAYIAHQLDVLAMKPS